MSLSKFLKIIPFLFILSTDRWDLYVSYINSVLQLVLEEAKVEVADGEQKPDTSFEECNEFLSQLIAKYGKKYRAPYLARIHLYRIMKANNADAEQLLGQLMELFVEFFRLFGEKPCCSKNIVNFLDLFTPEKLPDLAAKLLQLCNISSTTLPQTVRILSNFLFECILKCLSFSGLILN